MAEFTDEDRSRLRAMHDALLGTLEKPGGLLGAVDDLRGELRSHIEWNHEDPSEAAAAAVGQHELQKRHVADRRAGSPWARLAYDVGKNVATVVTISIGGWLIATFFLGLKISLAGTP